MGYHIYVNYLSSMEAHVGILQQDALNAPPTLNMEYARPESPVKSSLKAFITVFTKWEEFPDTATIDKVIDEGFANIGTPREATAYETIHTTDGTFEILCRPGFPGDPASVKQAIHEVTDWFPRPLSASGVYRRIPAKLYRYGKKTHLTEALKLGKFQITPASFYSDLSGDTARQDDELCRVFHKDPNSLIITTASGTVLKSLSPVKFLSRRAQDYYVLCLSMEFSANIAREFSGSEAVLIIHNPAEFANRLHSALKRAKSGYTGMHAPVSYGDRSKFGICFSKSEDYRIQEEFRFAWTSTTAGANADIIELFFVEIGSIEDIAELVNAPTTNGGDV